MKNVTRINVATMAQDAEDKKLMTVKEVAEAMDLSVDTIKNCIRRLMADKMQHGKTTLLNEKEVACISKELKGNGQVLNHLTDEDSSRVQKTTTDLEILENYKRANADFMALLSRKYEEEKQKREFAENTINRLSDSRGCYSMNQTAKALKLPYGNIKLYERLRAERILNSDNSPNQEQINSGRFKVVIKFINDKAGSKAVTLTTNKGLVYLAK